MTAALPTIDCENAALSSPQHRSATGGERPVVCHVVHSLQPGGAEVLATRIALGLACDYRPIVACLDERGPLERELQQAGVPVVCLHRRPGVDWRCARGLRAFLREHRAELVHAHQYTPFSYALLARMWQRDPAIILTEHGRFWPDRSSWKRRAMTSALFGKRDCAIGVGKSVAQALVDVERFRPARVAVIYNGIPLPGDAPAITANERLRHRAAQNAPAEAFVIAMVARFDPIKNHRLALQAFAELQKQLPTAHLWLIGDGPERKAIEVYASAAGLSQVSFLGVRRDVPTLLAAADAVLLTSHSEGIPLVLIEAMAAGVPVVATRVGGVPEIVEHGCEGWLAEPGSASELAAYLLELAMSPKLRQTMGEAGIRRAQNFSEPCMLASYRDLYAQRLARR